ncbi:MAG: hypothetical protein IPK80_21220 [Nannocystis sp.]|nr:hypothetical protein [Nannocystis sp.]
MAREEGGHDLDDATAPRADVAPDLERRLTDRPARACAVRVHPPTAAPTLLRPIRVRIGEPPGVLVTIVDVGGDHGTPFTLDG